MENELTHYGIKGMKWGVRRASKKLSKADTPEKRQKAVSTLEKHRTKGTKKVEKLEKAHVQMQKDVDRHIQKDDVKVAQLRSQAARKRSKASGLFVTRGKYDKLMYEADKLSMKADRLEAYSQNAKAKMYANENLTRMFKDEIGNIDKALAENGRKFING